MLNSRKAKGPAGFAKLMKGFSLGEFAPELPAIAEFSTVCFSPPFLPFSFSPSLLLPSLFFPPSLSLSQNETMGTSADRLATRFGVTRQMQDEYALRSHQLAAKAIADGKIKKNVAPVYYPKLVEVCDGGGKGGG